MKVGMILPIAVMVGAVAMYLAAMYATQKRSIESGQPYGLGLPLVSGIVTGGLLGLGTANMFLAMGVEPLDSPQVTAAFAIVGSASFASLSVLNWIGDRRRT